MTNDYTELEKVEDELKMNIDVFAGKKHVYQTKNKYANLL